MGYKQKHPLLDAVMVHNQVFIQGGGIDAKMESHRKPPKL